MKINYLIYVNLRKGSKGRILWEMFDVYKRLKTTDLSRNRSRKTYLIYLLVRTRLAYENMQIERVCTNTVRIFFGFSLRAIRTKLQYTKKIHIPGYRVRVWAGSVRDPNRNLRANIYYHNLSSQ